MATIEMDRFFENVSPDYAPDNPPLVSNGSLQNGLIVSSSNSLLQLLESKLNSKHGEVDWSDVSLYTGTAGYSLLYYFMYKKRGDPKHLEQCAKYAKMASKKRKHGRVTFLCGDGGPLTVSALAHSAAGDMSAATNCVHEILQMVPSVLDLNNSLPDELLYGRTGYLFLLNFLRQEIPSVASIITDDIVRQVLVAILESGRETASKGKTGSPLFYYWHDSPYVGAAHGVCGIIYHLLLNDRLLQKAELESLIKPSLDFILTLRFPSGNIRSSCGRDADRLVHWCHGAPGLVYTLTEGFRVFGDQKYLDAALVAGDVIWNRGLLKKGYGLCHGVAGNAYAFLNLFHVTGDQKHLHRAAMFAEFCAEYGSHGCRVADSPWSLFEGLAGTVYFMMDIQQPSEARFPAYQLNPS